MEHIGKQIKVLSNLLRREMDNSEALKEGRLLTGMHRWFLNYLYQNRDQDIYQRDLEGIFSIRRSTATGILNLMERNGLVERSSVESDKRLKKLTLTPKAVRLHEQAVQEAIAVEAKLRRGISDEEAEAFLRTLDKMKENLTQASSPDQGGRQEKL